MSLQSELNSAFDQLFSEIREEVVRQVFVNYRTFSVRGSREVFDPGKWRDKVRKLIKPILDKFFGYRRSFDFTGVVEDAAGRYAQSVAEAVEKVAEKAKTVEDLAEKVRGIAELNRQDLWAEVEIHAIEQALELEEQLRSNADGFKTWNTQNDERVRNSVHADHVMMNGLTIAVSYKFELVSGYADAPGAVTLSPEDRINCRCYLTYSK